MGDRDDDPQFQNICQKYPTVSYKYTKIEGEEWEKIIEKFSMELQSYQYLSIN